MEEKKNDGYGIHLSPCNGCYKRSISKDDSKGKGYYCADLIWDNRGTNEDDGENKRGNCSARFIIEDA